MQMNEVQDPADEMFLDDMPEKHEDDFHNDPYGNMDDDEEEDDEEDGQRLQAEETVLNNHLECVKQEAYLITVEGEIITKLENAMLNAEQYDMDGYLNSAEEIARQKLEMYTELLNNIQNFKKEYGEDGKLSKQ